MFSCSLPTQEERESLSRPLTVQTQVSSSDTRSHRANDQASADFSLKELPLSQRAEKVLLLRCLYCHQQTPSFLFPAGGVILSSTEDLKKHRERIYQRTVIDQDMPPNSEDMSEEERQWVRQWYETY